MKHRNLLSLLAFAGVVAFGLDAHAAPKLKIDNPLFNFGHTPEGLPVFHKYWAHNVGTDSLVIYTVRTQCGCTSVPIKKSSLAPGDSVALELKFDTKRFKGQISKSATVECNDTTREVETLKFTARVGMFEGGIIANPAEIYLDTLGKAEQVVRLHNVTSHPYKLTVTSPMADFMQVEFSGTDLPPNGEILMMVKPTPKTPLGEYNASITLHFEGTQSQSMTIPLYGVGYLP